MKVIKPLLLSSILALVSCSSDVDYVGEYSTIVKNSQGYFLSCYIPYADGQRFSNRWKINYDTTFQDFNYVIDPITFQLVPKGPAKGIEIIEVSASVSSSELQIYQTRTYTDTLGNIESIEHKDCVAFKQ
jgi:hypothetical protein